MVAFLHFQMVPKWLFVACLLHVCYICCILVTLSAFVAGSDICKFGDWGVWGVCNAGSQQRIRKVLEMMISMTMTIVMTNYHGDGDDDEDNNDNDESINGNDDNDCDNTDDDNDGHDHDHHHNDNNSGYQGVGESKVPKEGDRYAFLSLNDL